MSDDTWPDGESSFEAENGDDGSAWLDGAEESEFSSEPADIDTVDLQLGEDDEEPGAADVGDDEVGLGEELDPIDADLGPEDEGDGSPGEETSPDEPAAEETTWFAPDLAAEPSLGADPDHDDLVDSEGWGADAFPPELDFDNPPEPVDGLPWSDPAMLGDINDGLIDTDQTEYVTPDVGDLLDYSGGEAPGVGSDVWAELLGSRDPATSGLARWWAPSH
ncbi:hypothetical protein AB0I28_18920 [Phytomonospora sp. NPDC050363]|uniref:hypothetical protein n=1 Tax=Phytomonospora sp. NPDC050363 TaxID=3155642 RepID=UPI0033FFE295